MASDQRRKPVRMRGLAVVLALCGFAAACEAPLNTAQDVIAPRAESESGIRAGRVAGEGPTKTPVDHAATSTSTTNGGSSTTTNRTATSSPTTTGAGKTVTDKVAKSRSELVPAPTVTVKPGTVKPSTGLASETADPTPTTKAPKVTVPATTAPPTTIPTTTAAPAPTPAGVVVSVIDHGAVPNDGSDDQRAIQAAIDAAPAGATVLFPPGTYHHSTVINVRTAGVTLSGYGATLVATDARNHAVILRADTTSIIGFTLVASPGIRLSAEEQMGISLHYTNGSVVRDNTVRGTSSAGIFIWGASNYQIVSNTVEDTKSDGIHSVGGARDGLVEGNTLRNVGDDCFAVISYIAEQSMSRNITIRNNSCTGGRARGVSVVGGVNVLIQGNTIVASGAAGIYLASEPSYDTYSAKQIRVIGNTLRGVNTNAAIRHGAIFIWGRAGSASTSNGQSYSHTNEDILVQNNVIQDTVVGSANLVAQGSYSNRVSFVGNQMSGALNANHIEIAGAGYNMVGNTQNGAATGDHVGNASILP